MAEKIIVTVKGLYLGKDETKLEKESVSELVLWWNGILDDKRHYGLSKKAGVREKPFAKGQIVRNDRQVSIVSVEELDRLAKRMDLDEVKSEWLGANILFQGYPELTSLPPLTLIIFREKEDAAIRVYGKNLPCKGPGDVIQAHYPNKPSLATLFVESALNCRGVVGWVHRAGIINVGDEAEIILPKSR